MFFVVHGSLDVVVFFGERHRALRAQARERARRSTESSPSHLTRL